MARTKSDIVNPAIEDYLLSLTPGRDTILAEMEAYAATIDFPIVGPLVGHLLSTLAFSINARRILELGSGFGYSAYWFAKGTSPDTRITCTESDDNNVRRARHWFSRGNVAGNVDFRTGDALTILDEMEGPFDIIFCDINKRNYPKALAMSIPKLRTGGLFIADNVLWSGRVTEKDPDEDTTGVVTLNRALYADPALRTTIIPLRDGVSVSVRLQ